MAIKQREIYHAFSGITEVDYICMRHLCVVVNNKCHLCEPKSPTQEVSVEMQQLVKAFNDLTGKTLKRFSSLEAGQRRLAKVQATKAAPKIPLTGSIPADRRNRYAVIMTGAHTGEYTSLKKALIAANLPRKKLIKWRTELRTTRHLTIVNGDATYHCTLLGTKS